MLGGNWAFVSITKEIIHHRGLIGFFSVDSVVFTKWRNCCGNIRFNKMFKAAYSVTMNIFRKKNIFNLNHLQK